MGEKQRILNKIKTNLKANKNVMEYLVELISFNEEEVVLDFIKTHFDLLAKENTYDLVYITLFCLHKLKKSEDETNEMIERLKNTPYVSQEVEELLNSLDKVSIKVQKLIDDMTYQNKVDVNVTKTLLVSRDNMRVIEGINQTILLLHNDKIDLSPFIYDHLSKNNEYDSNYFLLLFALFSTGFNKEITFFKNDDSYTLNIQNVALKVLDIQREIIKRINSLSGLFKNLSLKSAIEQLFTLEFYLLFPEYLDSLDIDSYIAALFEAASVSYDYEFFKDPAYLELKKDRDKIDVYKELISESFAYNPKIEKNLA